MNIQIPIIGQQTRAGFVPQDNQSPIVVDDDRGAALQSFGKGLGDLAAGVAAWQKKQPQATVAPTTTTTAANPADYVTPNDPAPAGSGAGTTASAGTPTPAGPPLSGMGEPLTYTPVHRDAVARQDYEIAKSQACYAVPALRNTAARLFADARQSLGPSQAGLVPKVVTGFDEAVEQVLPACTTPESRLYVVEFAKQCRQQLARQALASEAQAGLEERATRYQASAELWAQVVAGDPGQIATALTALYHGMPDLDPAQREAARDSARTTLIHAGIMAEITRNPQAAYNAIVGAGGREDGAPGAAADSADGADPASPAATVSRIMTPAEREYYAPLAQAALYDQQAKQFEAFKTRQADTDAAYMATGTAQNPPTEPEFIAHYGHEEGQRLFQEQRIKEKAGQVGQYAKTLPARALTGLREQADPATPQGAAVHRAIDEIEKARRADPIAYALRNGSYGLAPITSFDDAEALKTELGKRRRAASTIADDYQATPTVLSREEAKLLAKSLQGKTVDEQKALLLQLTDGIGDPQIAQGALRALSTDASIPALAALFQARDQARMQAADSGAQSWGGGGNADIAALLLEGQTQVEAARTATAAGGKGAALLPDEVRLNEVVNSAAGQMLQSAPGQMQMLLDATRAIAVGLRLRNGGADYTSGILQRAVELASGRSQSLMDSGSMPEPQAATPDVASTEGGASSLDRSDLPAAAKLRAAQGEKLGNALLVPGKNDAQAIKTGQIDTHYDKTFMLGLVAGLPQEYALAFAYETQAFDDRPGDRPVDDKNNFSIIRSPFRNAQTLKENHFVIADQFTGKVPGNLKQVDANGKINDLRPPEGEGTVLGARWEAINLAINKPDATVREIAKAVGAYFHAFQDTFAHRDENNVPYDPVRSLFGIPLGFGHSWDWSHPDYTYNHRGTNLLGWPKDWTVNEARNLEMDKMVYERMQLIGDMLRAKGQTVGDPMPWETASSGLDGPEGDGVYKDVKSTMQAFNRIPEHEDPEKSKAEHRDPEGFPEKRKLLENALQRWGYKYTDRDGTVRDYKLREPPSSGGQAYVF